VEEAQLEWKRGRLSKLDWSIGAAERRHIDDLDTRVWLWTVVKEALIRRLSRLRLSNRRDTKLRVTWMNVEAGK
jgi:hypothetical protein